MRNTLKAAQCCLSALGVLLPMLAGIANASVPTLAECAEASEFIANVAHARDNGMSRDSFLARMEEDFFAIRTLPPGLRWFAKDQDDERMLLDAAARVFERPQPVARHRADFFAVCLDRIAAQASPDSSAAASAFTEPAARRVR